LRRANCMIRSYAPIIDSGTNFTISRFSIHIR
jgi:hypothetical protein